MSEPLVSVAVPVYNGAPFLRQAIDSALAQSYPRVEVIAVDDGSTDASPDVLREYGNRIRVIRQPNRGVGAARNQAILHARGQLLAFLDQDDWWLPEKLAQQVSRFGREEVGLVHTATLHYSQRTGEYVDSLDPAARPEALVGCCYDQLLQGNAICNSSVMVRRDLFALVGLCSPLVRGNTVQDYDFWLRFSQVCEFDFVAEPLTVFRIHGEQGTFDRRGMLTEQIRLLERVLRDETPRRRRNMRPRMAYLYDLLGTFHLDYHEHRLARRRFAAALRWNPRPRTGLLWALSWLPAPLLARIRGLRNRWKGVPPESAASLPQFPADNRQRTSPASGGDLS